MQIWIAVSAYVLAAIEMSIFKMQQSAYEILKQGRIYIFDKLPNTAVL